MKCKEENCNNEAPPARKCWSKKYQKYHLNQSKTCWQCNNLLSVYGINTPQRNKMLKEQNNKCACCDTNIMFSNLSGLSQGNSAVIDHCHTHGHIRGILCGDCNIMLGRAKDNVDTLLSGAKYLIDTNPNNNENI